MKLGELISALEQCDPSETVVFDFPWFIPGELDSCRNDYAELALDYAKDEYDNRPTVADFLAHCKETDGKTLTGYKGGNFRMDRNTRVWVANCGETTETILHGVKILEHGQVILETRHQEYESVEHPSVFLSRIAAQMKGLPS